ncbi:HD domain-containing protein [Desulfovibrio inopinatus]|uniref:[protein-PII] uridylyltransferase family protein n=1 Tax=Desulfovibrio inopinatus TaxID=102109 RepID=UPI000424B30B|nr:HD domain-containing protein [Desulfovibrio inopinatus]
MATSHDTAFDHLQRDTKGLFAAWPHPGGMAFCRDHTRILDRYFEERLEERRCEHGEERTAFAVVAVGGYGRCELCPRSDIDVLLVFPGPVPDMAHKLAKDLFYPLWDAGRELGHGVRSVEDCVSLSLSDHKVFASLLDARFLCGQRNVFDLLVTAMQTRVFTPEKTVFAAWLGERNAIREQKYGDASGLLEPDIKEGLGGLRDYNQCLWLITLFATGNAFADRLERMRADAEFLFRVRQALEISFPRSKTRLPFEIQRKLAETLGYADSGRLLAVERFLSDLTRRMTRIKAIRESIRMALLAENGAVHAATIPSSDRITLTAEGADFAPGIDVEHHPQEVFNFFEECARWGRAPSFDASARATHAAQTLKRDPPDPGHGLNALRAALIDDASADVLAALWDTGVLGIILPELDRVRDLVKFDLYHVHPVGRHTVETIRHLHDIAKADPALSRLFASVRHPLRLLLAGLLHDVGKGLGGDHETKGAGLTHHMLTALGLDNATISDVVFLVENHLLLSETAAKHDVSDPDVIARLATKIGFRDRLTMLYLLTVADAQATGPMAWTEWKSSLVSTLFNKVLDGLRFGIFPGNDTARTVLETRDKVRQLAKNHHNMPTGKALEPFLEVMGPRYLLQVPASRVVEHIALAVRLRSAVENDRRMVPGGRGGLGVTVWTFRKAHGGWRMEAAGRNDPGLFAALCGCLALHNIDIRSADVYVWRDDTVIVSFITSAPVDAHSVEEDAEHIARSVKYSLTGKLSLDYRLSQKRNSPLCIAPPRLGDDSITIRVDNDATELFTLIEVEAPDRLGLLYDIAQVLTSLRLDIHTAKAATYGDRVRDVFTVRDMEGRKIHDAEQLREIKFALQHSLKRC